MEVATQKGNCFLDEDRLPYRTSRTQYFGAVFHVLRSLGAAEMLGHRGLQKWFAFHMQQTIVVGVVVVVVVVAVVVSFVRIMVECGCWSFEILSSVGGVR